MLDKALQQALKPLMTRAARGLVRLGVGADAISLAGFAVGMGAATAIALQHDWVGLALLLISRLMDGLDGAVARATQPTDRGGFLDITLDFLFYASIPLAFAIAEPAQNALPAAVLLAAFIGTGSSFLAFAAVAEKRKLQSLAFPDKSFYFLGGLTEATETILAFTAMCLWPQWFPYIAYGFAVLCGITIAMRIVWGWQRFG
ncbi:MAG: CDP-alcohol phosphatidyltransferase family protein [Hydrogenophaga sp.]|uniref:CDP-alcohol phosphatidyltransferase family protein n=1 Tax=Hydrogenophaga sp. TaxID=1904254 RepID=UPI002728B027|nr:CDP-alcohol phosphatidyltransferase family protein [Hydrogenophaga sp.]MDO9148560.1 CDP-alcohol phosphatidyltransferase family protein [Hydrogenophaga sp.]MDO9605428.1 CDP-alcohol phosphatidyltransferase family protein [Hydrogenophaga sp.]